MTTIEVFDPAMCCSSGVCGPSVDPALSRFAADLDWLAGQEVEVARYNLAQEPGAFVAQPLVTAAMESDGEAALPLVLADGRVVSKGRFPGRFELAAWAGLESNEVGGFVYGDEVDALVAVAAAVAANCDDDLGVKVDAARRFGVADVDISRAVATAMAVKDAAEKAVVRRAGELLGDPFADDRAPASDSCCEPVSEGCCEPATAVSLGRSDPQASSAKCC